MPEDFVCKPRYYVGVQEVYADMDGLTDWDTDEDLAGRISGGVLCYRAVGWKDEKLPE